MLQTNEEVFELAKKNGIDIQAETMKGNESGLDYYVVAAEDITGTSWILRIPRRNDSMQEWAKEKLVLDLIKDKLPVQVPDWQIYTPGKRNVGCFEKRRIKKRCEKKESDKNPAPFT